MQCFAFTLLISSNNFYGSFFFLVRHIGNNIEFLNAIFEWSLSQHFNFRLKLAHSFAVWVKRRIFVNEFELFLEKLHGVINVPLFLLLMIIQDDNCARIRI
jgi:hypothetical protein